MEIEDLISYLRIFSRESSEIPENKTQGSEKSENNTSPQKDIQLVRVIDRTIHVSELDRQKEVDYVIRNPTDDEFNFVFLPLRQFERNLEVFDEDDSKLNVYPNRIVEDWLDNYKKIDHEGWLQVQQRFKHTDYKMLIQLPRERPLGPGEFRTITLRFEQSDSVEFHKITEPSLFRGWITRWYRKFFRIPSFIADVERFPGHPHDVFLTVIGPPGYGVKGESEHQGGEPRSELYENGLDDDTRVVSIRLPPPDSSRYSWDMRYELIPNNTGMMISLSIYLIVAVIMGIFSIFLALRGTTFGYEGLIQAVSGGLVTATLGLIFAINPEWTNRYKILSILPLLLHGGAWALWQFS